MRGRRGCGSCPGADPAAASCGCRGRARGPRAERAPYAEPLTCPRMDGCHVPRQPISRLATQGPGPRQAGTAREPALASIVSSLALPLDVILCWPTIALACRPQFETERPGPAGPCQHRHRAITISAAALPPTWAAA